MRGARGPEKFKLSLGRLAWVGLLVLAGALLSLLPVGEGDGGGVAASRNGAEPVEPLRFHVIANSDDAADQALKLAVRDAVVEEVFPVFQEAKSLEEARRLAFENRERLAAVARRVIAAAGRQDPVRVEIGQFAFPVKESGGLVLPAGRYEAVRLVIGAGEGHNWWCVMYPPLCVDVMREEARALAAPSGSGTEGAPAVQAFRLYEDPAGMIAAGEEPAGPEVRWALLEWAGRVEAALGRKVRWLGYGP